MQTVIFAAAIAGLMSTAHANLMNLEPGLAARQTGLGCTQAAVSILASVPDPTGELSNVLSSYASTANIANPTAFCAASKAVPTSLSAQFTSWQGQVASWYKSSSSQIGAVISSCTSDRIAQDLAAATSELQAYTASGCSGLLVSGATTTPTTTPTTTTTTTTTSGTNTTNKSTTGITTASTTITQISSSSSISTAAATKPTGVFAGAYAIAGVLGAAAII